MGCMMGKPRLTTVDVSSARDSCPVDRPATQPEACTRTSGTSEQGSGCCLDALTIALGQASEGKWYVSTLELQLASFACCVSCRGVRTLRVTVAKCMPVSLWDMDDLFDDQLEKTRKRHLPALRAAGVIWDLPTGMLAPELLRAALLKEVEWMQVVGTNGQYVKSSSTALPESRSFKISEQNTRLGYSPRRMFEKIISDLDGGEHETDSPAIPENISWPSSLRQLSLRCTSNVTMNWEALPSCLERLALGGHFEEPIKLMAWVVALKRLTLGGRFNLSIAGVVWPASLLDLTFGDEFNQPISGADVVLPASLLQLILGQRFNQPVTGVVWPSHLSHLYFGFSFNKPIAGVIWPDCLRNIYFGDRFNQPIQEVAWPASLLRLCFGDSFNQPIVHVVWPPALHRLVFGNGFSQQIVDVVWPIALQSIVLGDNSDIFSGGETWPASLRSIGVRDRDGDIMDAGTQPNSERPVMLIYLCCEDESFDRPPRQDSFDNP